MGLVFSTNTDAQGSEYVFADVLAEDVTINLKYRGCFQESSCPQFEVTISGNGLVVYKGVSDVSKEGFIEKHIETQTIAELVTELLQINYFERKDKSTDCYDVVNYNAGYYTVSEHICITSNHGPLTKIDVKFGSRQRQVSLKHGYSNDYTKISQKIIETAGVQSYIESDQSDN
jgi:hypothetical protein